MRRAVQLCLMLMTLGASAGTGQAPSQHITVPTIAPRAEDVATIDGMIRAWYEVVTVPAGQPRQWSRDRTLYMPDLRFVSIGVKDGQPSVRTLDHQSYVDSSDPFLAKGFFEKEIHRVTERFGPIAHVWSTYESRLTENGPIIDRGINSIELFWDGKRWWIANAVWTDETKDNPIPPKYLPPQK